LVLEEQAREAESLLGHRVFQVAVDRMKESLVNVMVSLPAGDPGVSMQHLKLKVLDEVVMELKSIVTRLKMAKPPSGEY
jgi:hypothetical protein